jgi:hypothetical protein
VLPIQPKIPEHEQSATYLQDSSSKLWGVSETENYLGMNSPGCISQENVFEWLISVVY